MNCKPAPRFARASVRSVVLLLFVLGCLAALTDLLLLGHIEDNWQLVPLVLLGLGVICAIGIHRWPERRSCFRVFQSACGLFLVSGFVGLYLHYEANAEFELEMYPSLRGFDLVWESLQGATPALAPAAMIQLGLIGLIGAFCHPAVTFGYPFSGGEK